MRFIKIVVLLTSLFIFAGCSIKTSVPAVESSMFESPISPVATATAIIPPTPTPIPLEELPTVEAPKAVAEFGMVYGRAMDYRGYPVVNATVRLGKIVWLKGKERGTPNEEGLVMADRFRSPQTETDEWGNFVISDVPPETYGIVVVDPFANEPLFVIDETGNKLRFVDVQSGDVINLKEVTVTLETIIHN